MTRSDIVERLRSDYRSCGFCRLERKEAAGEIERLRAALRSVLTMMEAGSTISNEVRVIRIIEEALGD